MTYPTSFGTPADQQQLGPLGVPVYASTTALAADVSIWLSGQIVAIANPSPYLLMAVGTKPSSYVTSSTSASGLAGGGQTVYWVYFATPGEIGGQSAPFSVRAVCDQLPAYASAGSGSGVLTASATGAIGSMDGVTLVAGDQIMIPMGITNVRAGKDSGPWVVTNPGATGVNYVLTRPWWFAHGGLLTQATQIKVGGAGTVFNNTVWRATAVSGTVIDTTDCAFYVERLSFQVVLASGTMALAAGQPNATNAYPITTSGNFPAGIWSATQSNFALQVAIHGTMTNFVSLSMANSSSTSLCTAGYVGTAAASIFALAAGGGTDASVTSTVTLTLINF